MFHRSKAKLKKLKKLKLRWWFLIVFVVGLGGLIGSVEISSQSSFCGSCHIMDPFYDSWKTSAHRTVKCIECHIPPGLENKVMAKLNGAGQVVDDLLNRVSMKPSASVTSFSCMRGGCHVREELATPPTTERSYLFDHEKHLDLDMYGITIACTSCHSHVRGETHFEVNTNVCIVCHMGEINDQPGQTILAGLHGGTVPGGVPAVQGNIANPAQVTANGEPNNQETNPQGEESALIDDHVTTASADCTSCHEPPDHPFEYRGLTVNHTEFLEYGKSVV